MGTRINQTGRHRLGMAGGVHCLEIPAVAAALAEHRRSWFTALISPARHSFAAMRKRSTVATAYWVPATAS
ncbi:hypothetical protein [Nocardia bhagyanarayanae]|uniref:Uncharacterized protein n=1 Tax=Nocardia bhagyanarayanae TaxID=1215925 RepID=A0A543EX68_9NOCA|nr:hypothetical protein [Nocardia bhagyanarayanae]TQM26162.1 hypothetical protein FB390_6341 [Nocardia bhagyanarayanae]